MTDCRLRIAAACVLSILASLGNPSLADVADDIGFGRLRSELGNKLPTGSGVEVIQVEASGGGDTAVTAYTPDSNNSEFSGKRIVDATGTSEASSGHATTVGRIFFGNDTSIAPGIKNVQSFLSQDFYLTGFLVPAPVIGSLRPQPAMMSARLGNHSFVGSFGNVDAEILARLDWVIETDEFIQVVGYNGSKNPIAASAFNAIVVDNTSAARTRGSALVDKHYTAKRTAPHLVVPEKNPSRATPWVAAAVALLIETSQKNKGLSNDSTRNRSDELIYNAGRSEVIKAALMAGASRKTENSEPGEINAYRRPIDRTANGLDRRYGAGQLDVYHSYKIIAAGEQNSDEDRILSKGRITRYGFDYDSEFGGALDSNPQGTYFFSTGAGQKTLHASLVWNIDIDGGIETIFIAAPTLHDMNLALYDISDSDDWKEIASSRSLMENTEHLWIALEADTDYALRVSGVGAFRHDYALAWRVTP